MAERYSYNRSDAGQLLRPDDDDGTVRQRGLFESSGLEDPNNSLATGGFLNSLSVSADTGSMNGTEGLMLADTIRLSLDFSVLWVGLYFL